MIQDWRPWIVELVAIKSSIHEHDRDGMWEFHYPRVGATDERLSQVEATLGFGLESSYRSFLRFADGWPWFYQSVTLFGTRELLGGELAPIGIGERGQSLTPIAASVCDRDVFAMRVRDGVMGPAVVWLAGEEVDRFPSFEEYFASMLAYNRLELEDLLREEGDSTVE